MESPNQTKASLLALPLIDKVEEAAPADWHGFTAVQSLADAMATPATDAPEPEAPQGAYGALDSPLSVPLVGGAGSAHTVELLAPAGGPEAAFAAFQFGADAIYLGLKKFSARAEAENFTLAEVDEITAYAHSLQPRRRGVRLCAKAVIASSSSNVKFSASARAENFLSPK